MKNSQKTAFFLALAFAPALIFSDDHGEVIFEDDFERSESQEKSDEPGNDWSTNSKSRAQGEKQVDLKDGTMRIFLSPKADHAVSVTHPAEFQDGAVGVKFMLEDAKDSIGLNFADLKFKEVHAGHLCAARISTFDVKLQDLKTGRMAKAVRDASKAKTLTADQKKMLKTKEKGVKNKLETGKWYDLLCVIKGDTMTVSIDGKEISSFSSEGIAHPTKRTLRLSIPKNVVIDDLKIWKSK
ncbi:LamG domain-containing protein [bacterium]|nr:LamG domain-containing protein [bacterium]